jgi:hypothetical protein
MLSSFLATLRYAQTTGSMHEESCARMQTADLPQVAQIQCSLKWKGNYHFSYFTLFQPIISLYLMSYVHMSYVFICVLLSWLIYNMLLSNMVAHSESRCLNVAPWLANAQNMSLLCWASRYNTSVVYKSHLCVLQQACLHHSNKHVCLQQCLPFSS